MRVLYIAHNHPSLHPGGTEIFTHDLFQAMKATGAEAMFLGCTNRGHRERKPGTAFQAIGRSADEMVLWSGHFDPFHLSQIDLHGIVPELTDFLRNLRPDIVHFHHGLLIGLEALALVKRVLPRARVVFTLHDYFPICAHEGQMVTTGEHALCRKATPDACHRCFPARAPDRFVLREKHIKNMFQLVDRFIAPSAFLKQRYVEWGLPESAIEVLANGRPEISPAPARAPGSGARRDAFAYFGNVSQFKGTLVALEAARILVAEGNRDFSLTIHGGAPFQSDEFKARFEAALKAAEPCVNHRGAYARGEMAARIAQADWVIVPSIWWENAPLVIQEAMQHRRPILCSNIGGMAEAVRDGIDGLHFEVGDPRDLARVMRRAMDDKGLWDKLARGQAKAPTIGECARAHRVLYQALLARPQLASA